MRVRKVGEKSTLKLEGDLSMTSESKAEFSSLRYKRTIEVIKYGQF